MSAHDAGLARFNELAADEAARALRSCCAAAAWVDAVAAGRPYPHREALADRAAQSLAVLDWAGVRSALDAHPRIGERAAGSDREAAWSRAEQSSMDTDSADARANLAEVNRAYEQRFGHVFLIFATGRSQTELLAAARQRLGHDDQTEKGVVRHELRRIVALRVTKLLDGLADGGAP